MDQEGALTVHETVMAQQILEVALQEAWAHHARRVTRLRLRLGDLEGVEADVLGEAFTVVAEGTEAAGAALEIERVPGRVRCEACGREATVEEVVHGGVAPERCPSCGGPHRVLQGRGWTLVSVRVAT